MDLKRLAVVLSQRLAPVYIAIALSWVTGYVVFTIGGIGLAIALELAWPLLRPLFEVLYEELMAQHSQAQAQRRTALLKTFLPFFQAYKTVLTTYPPAMLTASASEVGWCPSTAVMDKAHFWFIVPPRGNTLGPEGTQPWTGKACTVLTTTVAGMGSPVRKGMWSQTVPAGGPPRAWGQACEARVGVSDGTAYAGLEADPAIFETAVRALAEGKALRAPARSVHVDTDTVGAWRPRVAGHGRTVMRSVGHDLPVSACQRDEGGSFGPTKAGQRPGATL